VNWSTPWYYPEITMGAQYGSRRVPGFSKKSHLIDLVEGLMRRGYRPETIDKVLGANFLRVLREVWK
jgi:microsomal dipeptidase-like Zn-dependent dipeptidase